MNQESKYFQVVAKCGHVGIHNYLPITFAVVAASGKEAALKVRNMKRVKHHAKDAIVSCHEIDWETYQKIKEQNEHDPYLHCSNKQEQKGIERFHERVFANDESEETDDEEMESTKMFHLRKYTQWIKSLVRSGGTGLVSD